MDYSLFRFISTVLLTSILVFMSACDNTFEPFQENNRYVFSMYGTVDLHADTQWVRVMPVEQLLLRGETDPMGVAVSLTRNRTGESVTLNDSLFQFATDAFAWNYWSNELSIFPNEAYTITATMPDGRQSSAVATTPSELPVPDIEYMTSEESGTVQGSSNPQDSLVTVEIRYRVQNLLCGPEVLMIFSYKGEFNRNESGAYQFNINNRERISLNLQVARGAFRVNMRRVVIVSSNDGWEEFSSLTDGEIELPDVASNVENGTGFVPGIAKREIDITPPRERCYPERF